MESHIAGPVVLDFRAFWPSILYDFHTSIFGTQLGLFSVVEYCLNDASYASCSLSPKNDRDCDLCYPGVG